MTEVDDIRNLLEQGFRAHMVLREPTQEELSRLPTEYLDASVRVLPLWHPDGRKLMYYLKDPEAIEYAYRVVEEFKEIIGRDVVVYVSGIGPDTVLGRTLELEGVVDSLRNLLGWELRKSEYPNTFDATFRIQGDDTTAMASRLEEVRKVTLALSLRNRFGFVVASVSPGERYLGQPFSLKWGLQERIVIGLAHSHLAHLDKLWEDQDALEAAKALQTLYSQVTDDARLTVGWAAIEHIFSSVADHLLVLKELEMLINAVNGLDAIPSDKRKRLEILLRNPDNVFAEGRSQRIARNISKRTGEDFDTVYRKVTSLAKERARGVHTLLHQEGQLREHVAFVEDALWTVVEAGLDGPSAFHEESG